MDADVEVGEWVSERQTDVSYHEVLLQWRPGVHDWYGGHSVQGLQRDHLLGELGEATVHRALWTERRDV